MSNNSGLLGGVAHPKRWVGLGLIALPCLIYAMDLTILNLALPAISAGLAPTASEMLWIVDIYGFMVAGFLVSMGNLGDRIGRRRLLMVGAAAFGATSLLAAFATSPETLIVARALQGIAGATLAPSTLSLIRSMFTDDRERTLAIGIWVASFSAGAALGPVFGGLLIESFHWSAVFLVNVPLMALLFVLAPLLLPEHRDPSGQPLDIGSALLSLAAVLPFIYGVKVIAEGGAPGLAVASMGSGLAAGIAFVRRQTLVAHPMIDLKLFREPMFSAALTINMAGLFTVMATFVFIAQHFQSVLGLSPLEAGLWTAPSGVVFAIGSLLTPHGLRVLSRRTFLALGFGTAAVGFVWLALVPAEGGLPHLVGAMLVLCAGLAPVGTITTDIVMSASPPERAGSASAISETSFEFGAAAGIAVMGSLFVSFYRAALDADRMTGLDPAAIETARRSVASAIEVARHLPGDDGKRLSDAARAAFASAFSFTAMISALVSVVTAALAWHQLRSEGPTGRLSAEKQ